MAKRGLLVRVDAPNATLGSPVHLEIVTPNGTAVIPAKVLQPLPGLGVAVEVDPANFEGLAEQAHRLPVLAGAPPKHEHLPPEPVPPRAAALERPRTINSSTPPFGRPVVERPKSGVFELPRASTIPERPRTDPALGAKPLGLGSERQRPSTESPFERPRTGTYELPKDLRPKAESPFERPRTGAYELPKELQRPKTESPFETRTGTHELQKAPRPKTESPFEALPKPTLASPTPQKPFAPIGTERPRGSSEMRSPTPPDLRSPTPPPDRPKSGSFELPPRAKTEPPPLFAPARAPSEPAFSRPKTEPQDIAEMAIPKSFPTASSTDVPPLRAKATAPTTPPLAKGASKPPPIVETVRKKPATSKGPLVGDIVETVRQRPGTERGIGPQAAAGSEPSIAVGSEPAIVPSDEDSEPEISVETDEPLELDAGDDGGTKPGPSQALLNAQKIQLALHGDKNQRAAILREPNKMLHAYVLRNPGLQLDEVIGIAKMSTASIELLTAIANRREWAERADVAIALVRNPKTPVPLAIKMLDHVGAAELRALAKQQSVRDQIQRAARKKILG